MELTEAIRFAESDMDAERHIQEGYYLTSLMAIPESLTEIGQWTLVYHNPETQKVFSVEVAPAGVKKSDESMPLIPDEYAPLDYEGALKSKKLLSTLLDLIAEQRETPTRVIITLRDGEWKVAVITQSLKMLRIDLDMRTGELERIDKSNLVKPV